MSNPKTIQIPIPEGHEIESFDIKTGKGILKKTPKSIMERINSFDDILKENGITKKEFKERCKGLEEDEIGYLEAKLIASAYNEGWTPKVGERKYYPYFIRDSSGLRCNDYYYWHSGTNIGSRLCFKDSDHVDHAASLFMDKYEKFY